MNSTAQRARDNALRRHRTALTFWRVATLIATTSMIIAWVAFYRLASSKPTPSTWRSDQAPPLQRVHVVTDGFMDRQGQWRSFDTGERITVTHWTP